MSFSHTQKNSVSHSGKLTACYPRTTTASAGDGDEHLLDGSEGGAAPGPGAVDDHVG